MTTFRSGCGRPDTEMSRAASVASSIRCRGHASLRPQRFGTRRRSAGSGGAGSAARFPRPQNPVPALRVSDESTGRCHIFLSCCPSRRCAGWIGRSGEVDIGLPYHSGNGAIALRCGSAGIEDGAVPGGPRAGDPGPIVLRRAIRDGDGSGWARGWWVTRRRRYRTTSAQAKGRRRSAAGCCTWTPPGRPASGDRS
jgi:hypothetical protein